MAVFFITNDLIINGSIDHINDYYTQINCSDCIDLISLPMWPNITHISCTNCPNLVDLPLWPSIIEFSCANCPNLQTLPNWENIIYINWVNCPKLTNLPMWSNILSVNCHSKDITSLPEWSSLRFISLDCPKLIMPKWPNVVHIISTALPHNVECELAIPYFPKLRFYNNNLLGIKYHLNYIFSTYLVRNKKVENKLTKGILNKDIFYLLLSTYL